jgi:hypothetical protein
VSVSVGSSRVTGSSFFGRVEPGEAPALVGEAPPEPGASRLALPYNVTPQILKNYFKTTNQKHRAVLCLTMPMAARVVIGAND